MDSYLLWFIRSWEIQEAPPHVYNKLKDECLKSTHKVDKVKNHASSCSTLV